VKREEGKSKSPYKKTGPMNEVERTLSHVPLSGTEDASKENAGGGLQNVWIAHGGGRRQVRKQSYDQATNGANLGYTSPPNEPNVTKK